MSFQPRISVGQSKINPGALAFVHHLPGDNEEIHGVIGSMSLERTVDAYIQKLRSRFRMIDVLPDFVQVPSPEELNPATIPMPAPLRRKTNAEQIKDALAGKVLSPRELGDITGLPIGSIYPTLNELCIRGSVVIDHTLGRMRFYRLSDPAEPQTKADTPPAPARSVSIQKQETRVVEDAIHNPVYRETVNLSGGGVLVCIVRFNPFELSEDERDFVFDLVEKIAAHKAKQA